MGIGWSLRGQSSVSRCAPTLRHDGRNAVILWTDDDALCLDGQRLLLTAGAHLRVGAAYRLERSAGVRVAIIAAPADPSQIAFRLDVPDGSHRFFGMSDAALLRSDGGQFIRTWAIENSRDPYGNEIRYKYTPIAASGELLPQEIEYGSASSPGKRRLTFSYIDEPLRTLRHEMGRPRETTKLLQAIVVEIDGQATGRYEFTYSHSALTAVPLLTKVVRCGSGANCLPATTVDWTADGDANPILAAAVQTAGFHGPGAVRWLEDINGDGLRDYVTKTGDACIHWVLKTDMGWGGAKTQCGLHGLGVESWLSDINGDGLPDYVTKTNDGNIHWDLNKGASYDDSAAFGAPQTQGNVHGAGAVRWLIDINGDGLPDYVAKNNDGNMHWNVNLGGGWGPSLTQSGTHGLGAVRWLKDINDDGLPDYVAKNADGNIHWNLNVFRSNNQNQVFGASQSQGNVHGLGRANWLIDINGDRILDYVAKNADGAIHWDIGTGTGWGAPQTQGDVHGIGVDVWMVDINGDRLPDYVTKNNDGQIHWDLNLGRGYDANAAFSPPRSQHIGPGTGVDRWVTDVTGDGKADYVVIDGGSSVYVATSTAAPQPNLVSQITDPVGHRVSVEYRSMSSGGGLHRIASPRMAGAMRSQLTSAAFTVTHRMTVTDNDRPALTHTYTYEDGRYDLVERRWLGFGKIVASDTLRKNVLARLFLQEYPFEGYLARQSLTKAGGGNLSEDIAEYVLSPTSPYGQYPVLRQLSRRRYTLGGQVEQSATQINAYDSFAGLIETVTTANDNIRSSQKYTLSNDESKWRIGSITEVRDVSTSAAGQSSEAITKYKRNEAGDPIEIEETRAAAPKAVTARTYLANGLVGTEATGAGVVKRTWTHAYDPFGFLVSVKDPTGSFNRFQYDVRTGKAISHTVGNSVRQTQVYDDFGRLTKKTDAAADTEELAYAVLASGSGFSIDSVRSTGAKRREVYDSSGLLTSVETTGFAGKTATTRYAYDAAGRLLSESLPAFLADSILSFQFEYDVLDRETRRVNPWGEVVRTAYAARKETVYSNDLLRSSVKRDSADLMISAEESGGSAMLLERDPTQMIRSVSVGGNLFAAYAIDGASRIVSAFEPGRGTRSYKWDEFGNQFNETTPNSNFIASSYDLQGRRLKRSAGKVVRSWRYDAGPNAAGLLVERTSSDGVADALEYDGVGRLKTERRTIAGNVYRIGRAYDASGRLTDLILPGNLPNLKYSYTAEGELRSITFGTTGQVVWEALERDAQSRILRQQIGAIAKSEFTYEPGRQGLKTLRVLASAGSPLIDWEWSRDMRGNLLTATDNGRNDLWSYSLDGIDRVKSVTASQSYGEQALASRSFNYDALGNLTTNGAQTYSYKSAVEGYALSSIQYAIPPPADQNNTFSYSYDASGNILSDGRRRFEYNSYGEVFKVQHEDRGFACQFGRDANDEIATRECRAIASRQAAPLVTEHFLGSQFAREFRDGFSRDRFLVYAGDHLVAVLYGSVVDQSGKRDGSASPFTGTPKLIFPITDGLGTVVALVDETGKLSAEYRYSVFGERVAIRSPAQPGMQQFPIGFQGHSYFPELDLLQLGYRLYDPVTGRFTTPDPATDLTKTAQVTNRYAFALNNPLRFTDSSGLYVDENGEEFEGPAHPDPDRGQYADRGAYNRGDAGVRGYENAREGRFYDYNPKTGTVREFYDPPVQESVWDPIDLITGGLTSLFKGAFKTAATKVAPEIAETAASGAAKYIGVEGIYVFEAATGKTYVGQSKNIGQRLSQHVKSGKLPEPNVGSVRVIEVKGGKLMREMAEQQKINELGGIRNLENLRNPIGPKREHLRPDDLPRLP